MTAFQDSGRRAWRALLSAVLGTALSCDPAERVLTVRVSGQSAVVVVEALTVRRQGDANADAAPRELLVQRRLELLELRLPASARGLLSVQVTGLSEARCPLAQSVEVLVTLGEALAQEVAVVLAPLSPAGCSVSVGFAGDGRGAVTGDGVSCAGPEPCVAALPRPGALRLQARATADSYFAGWSGACAGTTDCVVELGGRPAALQATFLRSEVCGAAGFCWQNPLPQGGGLHGVFALSPRSAYAVGDNATVLRWNGAFWAPIPTGLTSWPTLRAVWVSSDEDVWVAGDDGTLLRGGATGLAPAQIPSPLNLPGVTLDTLWGAVEDGRRTVWVGSGGSVALFEDEAVSTGFAGMLPGGIFGRSPRDVWTLNLNFDCRVRHWTPALAQEEPIPGCSLPSAITGDESRLWITTYDLISRVGVIFERKDAHYREAARLGGILTSVWSANSEDAWAGDEEGNLLRYHGGAWGVMNRAPETAQAVRSGFGVRRIAGSGPDDVWIVGDSGMLRHYNGAFLSPAVSGFRGELRAAVALAPDDVWAAGPDGVMHWNGVSWIADVKGPGLPIVALWASGPRDVWGVTSRGSRVLRWRGVSWEEVPVEPALGVPVAPPWLTISGSGPDAIWIGGLLGTIERWDGSAFRRVSTGTTASINDIWVAGPNDVWAVGENGTVLRDQGQGFVAFPSPGKADESLQVVFSATPQDVWVSGTAGLHRYQGNGWLAGPAVRMTTRGIWGVRPDDLWFVGGLSAVDEIGIVHWDGAQMSVVPLKVGTRLAGLSAVAGLPSGELWTVGAGGTILHRAARP